MTADTGVAVALGIGAEVGARVGDAGAVVAEGAAAVAVGAAAVAVGAAEAVAAGAFVVGAGMMKIAGVSVGGRDGEVGRGLGVTVGRSTGAWDVSETPVKV